MVPCGPEWCKVTPWLTEMPTGRDMRNPAKMFQLVRVNETRILASIWEGVQAISIAPNSEK